MSNELEYTVYKDKPPTAREERRQKAQQKKKLLARPVNSIVCAAVDPRGLAIGDLRALFKSLPKSKKIGDSDILTPLALAVRSARDDRGQPEGSLRTKLFVFLSYVAVVAMRVGHGSELGALENAMQIALTSPNTDGNGEVKVLALDSLKSARTGVLHLHRVINLLVAKGWLPARATSTVISRTYLQPYKYMGLNSTNVDAIVDELLKTAPTDAGVGSGKHSICVAAELAKLDSKLSRDTTHKDLNYEFSCATCRSTEVMDINALLT